MHVRLKPVAQVRARQLSMQGIRLAESVVTDAEGIHLKVVEVVDVKTGEVLEEGDELKTTGAYDLVSEDLVIKKVSGKDPVLMPRFPEYIRMTSKYCLTAPLLARGFEGPVKIRFVPINKIPVEDIAGTELVNYLIID